MRREVLELGESHRIERAGDGRLGQRSRDEENRWEKGGAEGVSHRSILAEATCLGVLHILEAHGLVLRAGLVLRIAGGRAVAPTPAYNDARYLRKRRAP